MRVNRVVPPGIVDHRRSDRGPHQNCVNDDQSKKRKRMRREVRKVKMGALTGDHTQPRRQRFDAYSDEDMNYRDRSKNQRENAEEGRVQDDLRSGQACRAGGPK